MIDHQKIMIDHNKIINDHPKNLERDHQKSEITTKLLLFLS